jgi:RNA polymerase sigma factor (sigma-70 family)
MDLASSLSTSLSLLHQLRDWQNFEAWQTFVLRYRPVMVGWARRRGLSLADAEEVADAVLGRLPQALQTFAHDGRERGFRNFLGVAVRNAAIDLQRKRQRCPGGQAGMDASALLNQLEDPAHVDELEQELTEAAVQLNRHVEAAVAAVRASLKGPRTWTAFEQHCLQGRTAQEVADQLGIPKGDVYTYTSRVRTRLREELEKRLRRGEAGEGPR